MNASKSCAEFRRRVYEFQADELPEVERDEFQRHLDQCEECARRLEVEEGFLRALRGRLPRVPAPPGLETRLRAALRAEAPEPADRSWFRSPWLAAASAALILSILLVPALGILPGDDSAASGGSIHVVDQEVIVVDLDCDRAGMPASYQRGCKHPLHLNALKTRDGRYWHISPDQKGYAELIRNREIRGQHLLVDGRLYPGIDTIHMERYRRVELSTML